jgi:hypothetical protein
MFVDSDRSTEHRLLLGNYDLTGDSKHGNSLGFLEKFGKKDIIYNLFLMSSPIFKP